jgi:hypothetical protein
MRDRTTKILFYTIIGLLTFAAVFMLLPRPEPLPTLLDYVRARIAGIRTGDSKLPVPPITEDFVPFALEWPPPDDAYVTMGGVPTPGAHYNLLVEKEGRKDLCTMLAADVLLVRVDFTDHGGFVMTFSVPKRDIEKITAAQKRGAIHLMWRAPPGEDSRKREDEGKKEAPKKP